MDEVSTVMFIDTGTEREVIFCQKCKAKVRRKEERCPKCGRVLLWNWWEKK